jgi:DNA-directed RNA polymerase subunit RPC12/RpoP
MPLLWLKLPEVEMNSQEADQRPQNCPYCDSQILQRWGRIKKTVRDAQEEDLVLYRYRCMDCERTFRHYPEGVDRSDQSPRIRQIAGLAWTMGLSTRDVVAALNKVGVHMSRMSVWREGQNVAANFIQDDDESKNNGDKYDFYKPRKYAVDRKYIHRLSTKFGVVVAMDAGNGKKVVLGTLDEFNPWKVKSWMESLVSDVEVEISIMETGTLDGYGVEEIPCYSSP